MKGKWIALVLMIFMLGGCFQKTNEIEKEPEEIKQKIISDKIEEKVKTLSVDLATFHFVVDWLSDTKIVYVEKDEKDYFVKTFDIQSGEIDTLHKESKIIVDVILHPTKSSFLLHTTNNPASATIKIISLEGVVLDEVTVASSELAIEWNDLDPKLILLTAFSHDWTYEIFFYNGNNQELNIIALDNPFPKWQGTDKILTLLIPEHPLDGGHLEIYDLKSGKKESAHFAEVVHFETNGDSLLIVQINGNLAMYQIINAVGTVDAEWEMPAVSNYSEWVIPKVAWIEDTTVIMPYTGEGGQLDSLKEPFKLMRIENSVQQAIVEDLPPGKLLCSPNGKKCLAGYSAEEMIDLTTEDKFGWITFTESN